MSQSSKRRKLVSLLGTSLWIAYLVIVFGLTGMLLYACWTGLRP